MPPVFTNPHPFNFISGCGTADVFDFKMFGSKIIVPAAFTDAGREVWVFQTDLVNEVKTITQETNVTVFPVPASANLFIHIPNNNYCETHLRITNIAGELVREQILTGETSLVDVSVLPAGNYCATFINSTAKAVTNRKFVVTK